MDIQNSQLIVPFVDLPPHIQDVIAKKLSYSTFLKLVTVSKFVSNKRTWVLPASLTLGWNRGQFYINSSTSRKQIKLSSLAALESWSSMKFETILFWGTVPLREVLTFVERVGVQSKILKICDFGISDEPLIIKLIEKILPDQLTLLTRCTPQELCKFLQYRKFEKLTISVASHVAGININSFQSLYLRTFSINYRAEDIVRYIKDILTEKRSDKSEFSINVRSDIIRKVGQLLKDRLCLLYHPDSHDDSIFAYRKEKGRFVYNILFSDSSYNMMWLLQHYNLDEPFSVADEEDSEKTETFLKFSKFEKTASFHDLSLIIFGSYKEELKFMAERKRYV